MVTTNNVSDDQVFADLLNGAEGKISLVSGDGAYDRRKCYEEASNRGAKPTIPPRKNAIIWQHGNCLATPLKGDENQQTHSSSRTE